MPTQNVSIFRKMCPTVVKFMNPTLVQVSQSPSQGQSEAGDSYTPKADEITKDMERQCKVVDDALLFNDDITGNFFHTFDYLKLCGDNGITFNKFQFCQMEVEFAGFRVMADGVKPSRQILDNIANFPCQLHSRWPGGGLASLSR